MHSYVFMLLTVSGVKKMPDSSGGEFRSPQAEMDWMHLRVTYAHDSLHHLLPVEGVSACI